MSYILPSQNLDSTGSPSFESLTINSNIDTTSLNILGLTSLRIIGTGVSNNITNISLNSFITGNTNRITVSDNGSGGVSLNLPQDIASTSSPVFFRITLQSTGAPNSANLILRNDTNYASYITHRTTIGNQWVTGMGVQNTSNTNYQVYEYLDGTAQEVALNIFRGRNILINTRTSHGTNAIGIFGIGTGSAPSSSPADMIQCYSADIAAGHAAMHIRNENNTIVKLYQQSFVSSPTGGGVIDAESRSAINSIRTILINNGLMASS